MLGSDLVEIEKEDFVRMCDRYLDLFAIDYHQLRGAKGVEHYVELKEGAQRRVQNLQRLNEMQKMALNMEIDGF